MDKLILFSKLDSLKRCIDRIKEKMPDSLEALSSDLDRQDIIVLNLERAVQTSVEQDVQAPMSMSECFGILNEIRIIDVKLMERMKKSVGFRNIAVHEYRSISWEIVYSIIRENLKEFQEYARQILQWLEKE